MKRFLQKYDNAWWVCSGTPSCVIREYRLCWGGLSKKDAIYIFKRQ